ncbi:MAG TPA: adenylate/guanylate cyclase domain-containing protein [Flavobacteriales bacterium]|jgi:adenylate cyclase|nr:adenylate/guanylate cyclase domain-containing protein [Flavobacteriales bacterium]
MALTISKLRRRTHRTLRITLTWIAVGFFGALFESNVLARHGVDPQREAVLNAHFWRALIGGLLLGGLYIFVLRDRIRRYAYLTAVGIMSVIVLGGVLLMKGVLPALSFPDPTFGASFAQAVFSWEFLGDVLFWTFLMAATMLMVRLNDQFGSGAASYLVGRYHKPRQELRIFMFLDMRSSTAIAEEIGDVRYFQLLNEVYADITDPVIYSEGDIYQYVGDEISVSWKLTKGVKGERCLRCFFAIRDKLRSRADHYQAQYGIVPVFKAGFHYGQVTTGEVGLVKKQTIFTGDVVNTAAHIQACCNDYGVDNLISKELLNVLALKPGRFHVKPIGEIPLKGKRHMVELFHIEPFTAS